ncbi:MarR family winged helix-turn-helix transcriptional regulator [Spirillospora sp. NPDC048911]|uniref:MarR family winged helix-turn-helix transcriptional regulator n=1 Tax=Spirillospora sp. NPDC048911 TaxID=3364527 RepID=UPI00371152C5
MEKDLVELFGQAARRIRRNQMERLAPLGLTPSLSRALRVITSAEEPLRMAELAERLGVVPRSVTTVVDALEKAGLVTRAADPGNRRSTLVSPTEKGRAVRTRMAEARREAAEELFRPLTAEQREQLRALLALLDEHE